MNVPHRQEQTSNGNQQFTHEQKGSSYEQQGGSRSGFSSPARPAGFRGVGKTAGSPKYEWIFQNVLPIAPIAQPIFTETIDGRTIQHYEATIEPFQKQVYPNLGPANFVGYGKCPQLCRLVYMC
jgi:hypothetical protein